MKMKQSTDRLKVGRNRSVAAYDSVADGTVMVARGPHHDAIVKPFNDSEPPKSVGVLRYRRHHFMTGGLGLPDTAKNFQFMPTKSQPMLVALLDELSGLTENSTPTNQVAGWKRATFNAPSCALQVCSCGAANLRDLETLHRDLDKF